jgi:Uma2 family endonuclease
MAVVSEVAETPSARSIRFAEERAPIFFPESEKVPETQEHLEQRTLLYQLLLDALGPSATVGSDQFIYFDAEDPKQVVAPDVYVRLAPAADLVRSWKVWERGAPEVAIEIVSESDATDMVWQEKLGRYRRLGTSELVRFDLRVGERPLRIWNRVDGRLLERELPEAPFSIQTTARSLVLALDWVVRPLERLALGLRIEKDGVLLLTRAEAREVAERQALAERHAKEAERQAKEVERHAKEAAEARVRELEAELARR